ncbi:phasin family protein [Bradyrhizobium sp. RDM4]|uniref:phasin family protein n=1 Tax=Bradyrhizobium sp. RDM4 TaxID=3378765 RepID=UPI0038FC0D2C
MSDLGIQVPSQVKEMDENSVDQAEKAIAAFLDAAAKSVEMVPAPAKDFSKKTLSITEQNMKAALEHTRKLIHASDVNEFMRLQSEYLKAQFSIAQDQIKELGSGMLPSSKSASQNDV